MSTSPLENISLDLESKTVIDVPSDAVSGQTDDVPYSIFTSRQKALIVFLVSWAATFSSFSGNIYYPAIPAIASNLSVSTELVNITVTTYMIFRGFRHPFGAPLPTSKDEELRIFVLLLFTWELVLGLLRRNTTINLSY